MRLLHAGRGTGWWWPGRPVVSDGLRLWVDGRPFPLPGVTQLHPDGDTLRVELADRRVAEVRGTRWRFVRALPALPRVWRSEGYVYVEDDGGVRALDVIGAKEQLVVGPHGATLLGGDALDRGGAPGRSPQRLPVAFAPASVRWSPDGTRVAGVDADGTGALVDLRTFRAERREGVPVEVDTWLADGVIRKGRRVLVRGVLEASPARWGDDLAGPGGVVWSLREGRKRFDAPAIALGATVGTPEGFVTIDWRTHRGWTVDPATGRRSRRFVLPLDDDDALVGATWEDGAVHVESALGERLRIVRGKVEPGDRPVEAEEELALDTPAGPLSAADSELVGGTTYAWNEDGWLVAW